MFIRLFHPHGSDFLWKSGYLLWKLFARVDTIFPDRMMLIHLKDVSNCICWAILIWVWVKTVKTPEMGTCSHPQAGWIPCCLCFWNVNYRIPWPCLMVNIMVSCIIYIPIPPYPPAHTNRIFQDWKSIVDIPIHTHLRHRIYYIYKYL